MEKSTALFYSKNASSDIAYQVKNILNKFDYFTIYVQDIDDIILKNFANVNLLILDYTNNKLDDKSQTLIFKLVNLGYIKRLLIIKSNEDSNEYEFPCVTYDDNFNEKISDAINKVLLSPTYNLKVCDALCVKIIGNYLASIGFSLRHIGYSMLIDTITYLYANNCTIKNLNNDIYVYLANKYDKKVSSVEMNLRKSISLAHSKGKNFPFNYSPTNKEFITHAVTELYDKIYANRVVQF